MESYPVNKNIFLLVGEIFCLGEKSLVGFWAWCTNRNTPLALGVRGGGVKNTPPK